MTAEGIAALLAIREYRDFGLSWWVLPLVVILVLTFHAAWRLQYRLDTLTAKEDQVIGRLRGASIRMRNGSVSSAHDLLYEWRKGFLTGMSRMTLVMACGEGTEDLLAALSIEKMIESPMSAHSSTPAASVRQSIHQSLHDLSQTTYYLNDFGKDVLRRMTEGTTHITPRLDESKEETTRPRQSPGLQREAMSATTGGAESHRQLCPHACGYMGSVIDLDDLP